MYRCVDGGVCGCARPHTENQIKVQRKAAAISKKKQVVFSRNDIIIVFSTIKSYKKPGFELLLHH